MCRTCDDLGGPLDDDAVEANREAQGGHLPPPSTLIRRAIEEAKAGILREASSEPVCGTCNPRPLDSADWFHWNGAEAVMRPCVKCYVPTNVRRFRGTHQF